MKVYNNENGDVFTLTHVKTHLDDFVSMVWLDIQSKEISVLYIDDIDTHTITPEKDMILTICDNQGNILETYYIECEIHKRYNHTMVYKIKYAECNF